MKLGMVGLGRMGSNMVKRIMQQGHELVIYDRNPEAVSSIGLGGVQGTKSLAELVSRLSGLAGPRIVWIMLPAGKATNETHAELEKLLQKDDIVIDGGNSYFKDDVKNAGLLEKKGIRHLDVGTSGGIWGLERGYSLMIGGDSQAANTLEPIFKALAPPPDGKPGYLYCGRHGAGHFVKMIHNGIEYGMMQALAEGFDILRGADSESLPPEFRYPIDLAGVADVWRKGSVVSSWLLDLIALSLNRDPSLSRFEGHVPDSGEGRWALMAAIEEAVPAHVLSSALYVRFRSRRKQEFAEKLLSAMRNEFGGHSESKVA
ncbi:MAG: decarboxylating 6-phosphogluconate dehydrogenase [Oligoflexia bacterium]|nr:decarboxylating 6-phosphogluconate dehydrogenase [Oligoflexia bacterium]